MIEVGKNIREIRTVYGMNRNELARRVGAGPQHLYLIEKGERTPSLSLLERIAEELHTEPYELLRKQPPAETVLAGKAKAPQSGRSRADFPRYAAERIVAEATDLSTEIATRFLDDAPLDSETREKNNVKLRDTRYFLHDIIHRAEVFAASLEAQI